MVIIKEVEVVAVSNKYKKCSDTKDDKKKLACFDNLMKSIKEREKKYEKIYGLNIVSDYKIKMLAN